MGTIRVKTCGEFINEFIVHYYRISEKNKCVSADRIRCIRKILLSLCIYLENRSGIEENTDDNVIYEYSEILKELDKFTEVCNDGNEVRIKRWFPSLVEGNSFFYEFAKILWVEQHYFNEEEKNFFEEIFFAVLEYQYLGNKEITVADLKERIGKRYDTDKKTPQEIANWMVKIFDNLMEEYLNNLYIGEYSDKHIKFIFLENVVTESVQKLYADWI
ncbi:MAG: hypothetical protein NC313_05575 [Butyrivibrio sp.]|nr:hypothetical protein [Butyrivibrio sp.]